MLTAPHILFPFDFSEPAALAGPFVRAIAEGLRARVTLFSVVPPIWEASPVGMPVFAETDEGRVEQDMKSRLDMAVPELDGWRVERVVDYGDPALRIIEYAQSNEVDLIMMPTHGFGLFRSLLIGSVTAKVLHDARCPVWTATHAEEQRSRALPKSILCAVDGTPKTSELVRWAADFSRLLGASLELTHIAPSVSDWLALETERNLQEQVRADARENIQMLQESAGLAFSLRVGVGEIADGVAEEARQDLADLVIIGRGSLQSALGRLRTHAYGIVQKSPCPVVSV